MKWSVTPLCSAQQVIQETSTIPGMERIARFLEGYLAGKKVSEDV
jgi:hypothetical protein